MDKINNLRVKAFKRIAPPAEVMREVKVTRKAAATVIKARENIQAIFDGRDERKIVIVGPCSIHDGKAALEYAEKLNELRKKVEDRMVIVMRAYFEKPRTTVGWKGFIYDPFLDDSYSLDQGVVLARKLLVKINDMGLPTATEVLGTIVIQYYADLICWSAIGARTTESQAHRELASGLSMPVGFKNGTEGNVDIAVNAIVSAASEHAFLGMDQEGKVSVVETRGNPYGHIILRGGKDGPNYSAAHVAEAEDFCRQAGVVPRIIVDCSHGNSGKDFRNQAVVWEEVWRQIKREWRAGACFQGDGARGITADAEKRRGKVSGQECEGIPADAGKGQGQEEKGSAAPIGLMLESNLFEGRQNISGGWGELAYGVSVTDGCIGFEETERLVMGAYKLYG